MDLGMNGLKVLLVDDQNDSRALLRTFLGELGVTQIFEASNGREALQFMDAAFDFVNIVVCDWNMPKMTGVELLRQLRTVDPEMPFLMISGRCDFDSVVEAKEAGVSGYIRKPFSPAQLEIKLRTMMGRHTLR